MPAGFRAHGPERNRRALTETNLEVLMTSRLNQNIQKLKRAVKGNIVRPQDARYDKARQAWNAMIDRRPM